MKDIEMAKELSELLEYDPRDNVFREYVDLGKSLGEKAEDTDFLDGIIQQRLGQLDALQGKESGFSPKKSGGGSYAEEEIYGDLEALIGLIAKSPAPTRKSGISPIGVWAHAVTHFDYRLAQDPKTVHLAEKLATRLLERIREDDYNERTAYYFSFSRLEEINFMRAVQSGGETRGYAFMPGIAKETYAELRRRGVQKYKSAFMESADWDEYLASVAKNGADRSEHAYTERRSKAFYNKAKHLFDRKPLPEKDLMPGLFMDTDGVLFHGEKNRASPVDLDMARVAEAAYKRGVVPVVFSAAPSEEKRLLLNGFFEKRGMDFRIDGIRDKADFRDFVLEMAVDDQPLGPQGLSAVTHLYPAELKQEGNIGYYLGRLSGKERSLPRVPVKAEPEKKPSLAEAFKGRAPDSAVPEADAFFTLERFKAAARINTALRLAAGGAFLWAACTFGETRNSAALTGTLALFATTTASQVGLDLYQRYVHSKHRD